MIDDRVHFREPQPHPHFLQFDDSDCEKLGFPIKCNPAIKTAADREGIIKDLAEGRIR